MIPPDMADYAAAIQRGFDDMMVHETTELWCEPGRALVAEASSLLVKVELKKGDALYLNDGSYGSLFDATHFKWPFPVKLVRPDGGGRRGRRELRPFRFYGPTCDSIDHMPGPLLAAGRHRRGRLHRDRHAGRLRRGHEHPLQRLRRHRDVAEVADAPMASMFGLAPRFIPLPEVRRGRGAQGGALLASQGRGGPARAGDGRRRTLVTLRG